MKARASQPYLLSAPGMLLFLGMVAAPLAMTLLLSFRSFNPMVGIGSDFSLANYAAVLSDGYFHAIFLRTFRLAITVTVLAVLIGVPEAYVLSRMRNPWRALFLVVALGPLLISVVVRTLGWAVLLGSNGLLNSLLIGAGIVDSPVQIVFTFNGVVIGLLHVLVPFVVIAVWAALQKLDPAVEQAAVSLGAGELTVLWRVVLPQVMPGVLSGSLIVFALSASAFATPSILGGRRLKVVPTTAYDEFLNTLNWPLGAAIALLLLVAVVSVTVGYNRIIERRFHQSFEPGAT
jgi:putative spermidine/putrescine transport system permease protein